MKEEGKVEKGKVQAVVVSTYMILNFPVNAEYP